MPAIWAGPTTWMFQYQVEIYDLLKEIAADARGLGWRAAQHRRRLQPHERIYFLRGSGQAGHHEAAIVAVGVTESRVWPSDRTTGYPWRVNVKYQALVQPPLTRDEMKRDSVLRDFTPYCKGLQGTQFPLPPQVALRTEELLRDRLRPLAAPPEPPAHAAPVYRPANEEFSVAVRGMIQIDPERVERANRAHAKLQNMLEAYLRSKGLPTRSYDGQEPNFDLAWLRGSTLYVGEVKSLTKENEEMQMRLGFSQVLMYRLRLVHLYPQLDVRAVLFVEREPTYSMWEPLCAEHRVVLAWPTVMHSKLP